MILLSVMCVFPLYWMLASSLRPANEIFETTLWPSHASLESYRVALDAIPIVQMLLNTLIVSVAVTVIQCFTGLLAAYGFVRWQFRGNKFVFGLFALTWLVPFQVVMIPNYLLVAKLGLLDSLSALILPHFASAFAIMMLAQAMRAFPREVLEAARIDGAGSWRVLWEIVTPSLRGTLASLAILVFISTWNEYFWPLLLSRTAENSVIQIGIQMFMTSEGTLWGPLMAASTMASLPVLAIYLVLQRQVVQSFMKSGIR
ncbi:binding-protein dependent transport system inner membrane protein [Pandoraea communis]|uniref:Binding-protein dependent transport system inner membrane protein n=2 Tax=Pandoraea communis TaxID=2508297 RepID=A0A5E4TBH8_9BURK|nr:binding-protein dependent transport system inner membrane protein [Pandoraea communis]